MCESTVALKGKLLELAYSEDIHRRGIPLLLSSKLLRSYDCGQVDLAVWQKGRGGVPPRITLYEVKASGVLSSKQRKRLKRSASLLGAVFDILCFCQILDGLSLVKSKGQSLNS